MKKKYCAKKRKCTYKRIQTIIIHEYVKSCKYKKLNPKNMPQTYSQQAFNFPVSPSFEVAFQKQISMFSTSTFLVERLSTGKLGALPWQQT